jgi:hypothetical protein
MEAHDTLAPGELHRRDSGSKVEECLSHSATCRCGSALCLGTYLSKVRPQPIQRLSGQLTPLLVLDFGQLPVFVRSGQEDTSGGLVAVLCRYNEAHGFVLRGRIEQHPGYDGCLYQLATAAIVGSPDPDN